MYENLKINTVFRTMSRIDRSMIFSRNFVLEVLDKWLLLLLLHLVLFHN